MLDRLKHIGKMKHLGRKYFPNANSIIKVKDNQRGENIMK